MKYQVIDKDSATPVISFETECEARIYISKYVSWATHYVKKAPEPCSVEGCNRKAYPRSKGGAPVGYWCSMHYKAKTYPYKN